MKAPKISRKLLITLTIITALLTAWFLLRHPENTPSIANLAKAPTGNPETLHDRLIPETDLPPAGTRSLFDHVVVQNDGLPYPFEKLVALLQKHHPEGQPPVSVLIPPPAPAPA